MDNCRPASILPNVSKLFERPLFGQMPLFFDQVFSMYQCGFRKDVNPQHCVIAMLEKWRLSKGKGDSFGALLTDLSKIFDFLLHELLIAKLAAYDFSRSALKLMYSYLFDRKLRTKTSIFYSSWQDILSGVPQDKYFYLTYFFVTCCLVLITLTIRVMWLIIYLTLLMKAPRKL